MYGPTGVGIVYGRENIPDDSFIISSNHNSHMDVALLSVATKKDYNQIAMLAAKDYFFDSYDNWTLAWAYEENSINRPTGTAYWAGFFNTYFTHFFLV